MKISKKRSLLTATIIDHLFTEVYYIIGHVPLFCQFSLEDFDPKSSKKNPLLEESIRQNKKYHRNEADFFDAFCINLRRIFSHGFGQEDRSQILQKNGGTQIPDYPKKQQQRSSPHFTCTLHFAPSDDSPTRCASVKRVKRLYSLYPLSIRPRWQHMSIQQRISVRMSGKARIINCVQSYVFE